ncbi:hypothetical protein B0H10DRAFT_1946105 [Mycena sp. CBHHK59/15]|nr:hypothetical protein B0H10DRAFT_1946105 [Mycena sp. CBHHK59/15]
MAIPVCLDEWNPTACTESDLAFSGDSLERPLVFPSHLMVAVSSICLSPSVLPDTTHVRTHSRWQIIYIPDPPRPRKRSSSTHRGKSAYSPTYHVSIRGRPSRGSGIYQLSACGDRRLDTYIAIGVSPGCKSACILEWFEILIRGLMIMKLPGDEDLLRASKSCPTTSPSSSSNGLAHIYMLNSNATFITTQTLAPFLS